MQLFYSVELGQLPLNLQRQYQKHIGFIENQRHSVQLKNWLQHGPQYIYRT